MSNCVLIWWCYDGNMIHIIITDKTVRQTQFSPTNSIHDLRVSGKVCQESHGKLEERHSWHDHWPIMRTCVCHNFCAESCSNRCVWRTSISNQNNWTESVESVHQTHSSASNWYLHSASLIVSSIGVYKWSFAFSASLIALTTLDIYIIGGGGINNSSG